MLPDKKHYEALENRLPITAGGYEDIGYVTPVMTVEEYLEQFQDPYYCELVVLPDGRIIPAQPSHAIVMDSLLNFLNGSEPFILSRAWLVEERLYYTGAIMVWKEVQTSYDAATPEQEATLKKLVAEGRIEHKHNYYEQHKRDYFARNAIEIHEEALVLEANERRVFAKGDGVELWLRGGA